MYGAFDKFLKVPSWYSRHPSDEERFFRALDSVVRDPKFNADALGDHMDLKRKEGMHLIDEVYEPAREHYVQAAHAVDAYLRAIREL